MQRDSLLAGPYLAGGEGFDLVGGDVAADGDVGHELAIHVVDQRLEVDALFGRHFVAGVACIFQRAGVDDLRLEFGPFEQVTVVGPFHDDADGAHDAGLICVDLVGGGSDVVGAAGSDAFDGGDDGFPVCVADVQDLVIDLLGGRGSAAGRID